MYPNAMLKRSAKACRSILQWKGMTIYLPLRSWPHNRLLKKRPKPPVCSHQSATKSLTPGSFAKVKMILGEDNNALLVPNTVIIPQGRKKQIFLFKGGKAMPSDVVTVVRDSTNIQILQGVNPGDTVITSGILFLRPGMEVTPK